jgi:ATP-dependent RNA helicase DDX5/DBP2
MAELSKDEQKEADKAEATKRGITYKEVRQERRSNTKKRSIVVKDDLEDSEHGREVKRMRAYSKDFDNDDGTEQKRRRTRSVDLKEEQEAALQADKALTVAEWHAEHTITIRGHGKEATCTKFPDPYREFSETPFCPRILESFKKAGFTAPTAIQGQAWPIALQGKDMICVAKTGSGKTCGFLLPAFHKFLQDAEAAKGYSTNGHNNSSNNNKPKMLVLAPTRELSVQIMEEAVKFGRLINIRSLCCYGGSSKYPQIAALQRGQVECIIATPGRLNDLIEMKKADLSGIQFLVLDEVRCCCFCE